MDFFEAMTRLRAGEWVRAVEWTNSQFHLRLIDGKVIAFSSRDTRYFNEWSLNSSEINGSWAIYTPARTLADVLPAFLDGKFIRRRAWSETNKRYLVPRAGGDRKNYPYDIGSISALDVAATDWEIVE